MNYLQDSFPIVDKQTLSNGIYSYTLLCPTVTDLAIPGQFVHIRVAGFTLRRPISICQIDQQKGLLRLVFEERGNGTHVLAQLGIGDVMDLLAPLGNGFTLLDSSKKAIVIGGGIGVPPLLGVAAHYGANATAVIGFRDSSAAILEQDFATLGCNTLLCTDNGTKGIHGYTTTVLEQHLAEYSADILYACGPKPMLQGIQAIAARTGIRCQLSLEERMGCGVGACLVCACKVKQEDGSAIYQHVCKHGPIFEAATIDFSFPSL